MQGGPKKVFEHDPNSKNSPEGPEKCKKAQNLAEFKTNKLGLSWAKLSLCWGLKLEFEVEA